MSTVIDDQLAHVLAVGLGIDRPGSTPRVAAAAVGRHDALECIDAKLDGNESSPSAAAKLVARAAVGGDASRSGQCACCEPHAAARTAAGALADTSTAIGRDKAIDQQRPGHTHTDDTSTRAARHSSRIVAAAAAAFHRGGHRTIGAASKRRCRPATGSPITAMATAAADKTRRRGANLACPWSLASREAGAVGENAAPGLDRSIARDR